MNESAIAPKKERSTQLLYAYTQQQQNKHELTVRLDSDRVTTSCLDLFDGLFSCFFTTVADVVYDDLVPKRPDLSSDRLS